VHVKCTKQGLVAFVVIQGGMRKEISVPIANQTETARPSDVEHLLDDGPSNGLVEIGDDLSFAQPIGFGMGYLQLEEIMSKITEAVLPVSAIKLAVVVIASLGLFAIAPLLNNHAADSQFVLRLPDLSAILPVKRRAWELM
jgi:hypothetical protein